MIRIILTVLLMNSINFMVRGQPDLSLFNDSIIYPASLQYSHTTIISRFFLGTNYRKVWTTPVRLPVFLLTFTKGGFVITKLGGGEQTKSLHLKDQNGIEWMLRTIDKDVEKAMPLKLRHTIAQRIVQDMVSAAHPYAPLPVSVLADAAGVVAAKPQIFFVPDDTALKQYRPLFANTVCLLERHDPTPDTSETESTSDVLEKIVEKKDHLIIQQEVLRARLLDMLIADWDRHADQWRWGTIKSSNKEFYFAIPRDRDQAFFNSNGLLVKIVRLLGRPYLVGFKEHTLKLKDLNFKSWNFDKTFLNELDEIDWKNITQAFQCKLSDSVISLAVHKFPPEIYKIDGKEIERKLKARRDRLMKEVMSYYYFISNHVIIKGTNEQDIFKINGDGKNLWVAVINPTVKRKTDTLYFRKFNAGHTHTITLLPLDGNDTIEIDKTIPSKINIIVSSGAGKAIYNSGGKAGNRVTIFRLSQRKIKEKLKSYLKNTNTTLYQYKQFLWHFRKAVNE